MWATEKLGLCYIYAPLHFVNPNIVNSYPPLLYSHEINYSITQEIQATRHCELLFKDQSSWNKLPVITMSVCYRIYSMVLCSETCYKSPSVPGRRIHLPLFLSDLWNCQQMSDFLFHPPKNGQAAAWVRFYPTRLINFEILLSWLRWFFIGIEFGLKQASTLVSFVQLHSKDVISVSLLTLTANKANKTPYFYTFHASSLKAWCSWSHSLSSAAEARGCVVRQEAAISHSCRETLSAEAGTQIVQIPGGRQMEAFFWRGERHLVWSLGWTKLHEHFLLSFPLQEKGQQDLKITIVHCKDTCFVLPISLPKEINSRSFQNLPVLGRRTSRHKAFAVSCWSSMLLQLYCRHSSLFCLFNLCLCTGYHKLWCCFECHRQQHCWIYQD